MIAQLVVIVLVFAGSAALTWVWTRLARQRSWLDVPNSRSSHTTPTPRGGGIAIVLSSLVAVACLAAAGYLPGRLALALLGGGGLVAAVGAIDDRTGLPPSVRLSVHVLASGLVVLLIGSWAGVLIAAAAMCVTVWSVNLTNFMDGIDGIAAGEAVSVFLAGALITSMDGHSDLAIACIALAAASAGFLLHNWAPARVFMGDVSSGFLGLAIATVALAHVSHRTHALWSWLILFAAFVVDATATLARRWWRRQRLFQAHRSHAYQHAARQFGHGPVAAAFAGINMFWLTPLAVASMIWPSAGAGAVIAAFCPLTALAWRFRAGLGEGQTHASARTGNL